jgi:hypothetical protein
MAGVFKGKDGKKDPKSPNLPPKSGSSLGLRSQSTSTGPPAAIQPVAIPSGVVGTFTNHATDLAGLLAFDQKTVPSATVPIIISKCCNRLFEMGLSTEGIFRVPGNTNRLTKCENEFNLGQGAAVDFKRMGITVEDAASLLKKFLRESLSDTLFPIAMVPEFEALRHLEGETKNASFLKLWNRLPSINRAVLSEVLELLMNVAANSFLNLMNIDNLGTVFGGMADIPMPGGKWMLVYLLEEYENLFGTPTLQKSVAPVIRRKLINHTRSIFCLGYVNKKYVLSCDGHVAVNVWDADDFSLVKKMKSDIRCYVPQVFVTVESAQIHQLWMMFSDGIRVWDISTILDPRMPKFEDAPSHTIAIPNACACAQVGETIWIAGDKVQVVDAITHAVLKEISEYTLNAAGASPVHVLGYAAGYIWIWHGKVLHVWHPESYQKVREITIEGFTSPKTAQIFASDGNVWLSTDQGSFLIVDVSTFEIKQVVKGHSAAVYHIENVGPLAWSCSWDTTICWWRTSPTVELLYKMPNRHSDAVSYLLPVWREHLNGWDVWSASWDRSCQVTFVPASYADHIAELAGAGLQESSSTSSVGSLLAPSVPSNNASPSLSPSTSTSNLVHNSSSPILHTGVGGLPAPLALNAPGVGIGSQRPSSPVDSRAAVASWGAKPQGASSTPPGAIPLPLATPPLPSSASAPGGFALPPPTSLNLPPIPAGPKSPKSPRQIKLQFEPMSLSQMEAQVKELEAKLASLSLTNDRELDSRLGQWTNPPSPTASQDLKAFIKQANESEADLQLKIEELRLRIRAELHAQRYALIYSHLGAR